MSIGVRVTAAAAAIVMTAAAQIPRIPVGDEIAQTSDYVVILVERVHGVRIVRMNGTYPPQSVRPWMGDSTDRRDGDTLVVDTTNFTDETWFRGASSGLHVIERFTRGTGKDAGAFLYKVTIDNPATFLKQCTMEYPFPATPAIFECACHEGNYAMTDIPGGAPKEDADSGKKVIIVT